MKMYYCVELVAVTVSGRRRRNQIAEISMGSDSLDPVGSPALFYAATISSLQTGASEGAQNVHHVLGLLIICSQPSPVDCRCQVSFPGHAYSPQNHQFYPRLLQCGMLSRTRTFTPH